MRRPPTTIFSCSYTVSRRRPAPPQQTTCCENSVRRRCQIVSTQKASQYQTLRAEDVAPLLFRHSTNKSTLWSPESSVFDDADPMWTDLLVLSAVNAQNGIFLRSDLCDVMTNVLARPVDVFIWQNRAASWHACRCQSNECQDLTLKVYDIRANQQDTESEQSQSCWICHKNIRRFSDAN